MQGCVPHSSARSADVARAVADATPATREAHATVQQARLVCHALTPPSPVTTTTATMRSDSDKAASNATADATTTTTTVAAACLADAHDNTPAPPARSPSSSSSSYVRTVAPLRMPPDAEGIVRRALAAQRTAAHAFDVREADAAAEQRVRQTRWQLLRAQRRRREAWAQRDAAHLRQTHAMLEMVVRAVRDRLTTLHADGYQAFVFPNGDVYEGHWKNSYMHGKGVLRRDAAKDVYEGQWFLGQRCGAGMYHGTSNAANDDDDDNNNNNNNKQNGNDTGMWQPHDRLHRQGSDTTPTTMAATKTQSRRRRSGDAAGGRDFVFYNGAWLDDKMHGKGELLEPEGLYVGEFVANRLHGYGEYVYTDGHVYRGEWSDGLYEGSGIYLFPSGARYEGRWLRGRQHGRGMMTYFNGDSYVGEWRHDVAHGHGVYTSACMNVQVEGEWAYGTLHGGEATATWYTGSVSSSSSSGSSSSSSSSPAAMMATCSGRWWRDRLDGEHGTLVVVADEPQYTHVYHDTISSLLSGGGGGGGGGLASVTNVAAAGMPSSLAHRALLGQVANVKRYTGGFVAGKRHGHGEYRDLIRHYVGEWCADDKHGNGTLTIEQGGTFAGTWHHGDADGEGTLTSYDGTERLQLTLRRGVCERVVNVSMPTRADVRLTAAHPRRGKRGTRTRSNARPM